MKKFLRTALPVLGLLAAVAVFLTALLFGRAHPRPGRRAAVWPGRRSVRVERYRPDPALL